ncbi:hypothetical protein GCK32_009291 [Trichostrongylus colubriformis]|uniref:SCP domain-containing protein n=1 Tax=Trichostrongylus colubriformis TaxID=6319 RepID=A0AAN8IDA0_TRICO
MRLLFMVLLLIYGASGLDVNAYVGQQLNELRQSIANGSAPKPGNGYRPDPANGYLPSSSAMFTLTRDAWLASVAQANAFDCITPDNPALGMGASMNYYMGGASPSDTIDEKEMVDNALAQWKQEPYLYGSMGLNDDVIYRYQIIENFANIIYYQSTKFGCHLKICNVTHAVLTALVCVFDKSPILNSPLYIVSQNRVNGCASDSDCEQALPFAKCNGTTGLCSPTITTDFIQPPTTPSTTTTTTTMPGLHGTITEEIRRKIINMHNYRRSRLAQGLVQNGKTGRMLPAGSNIFNMSYSIKLEQAAQKYANTCPSIGSTSLTNMGENLASISSNTKSFQDCIYEAIKSFWSQIKTQRVNFKVMFTEKLAKRPDGPLKFTQMAWAETHQVGCGAQRCGQNTVVVCRYSPRGNIVNQTIYRMGRMCTTCPYGGCTTDRMHQGLCPAPVI